MVRRCCNTNSCKQCLLCTDKILCRLLKTVQLYILLSCLPSAILLFKPLFCHFGSSCSSDYLRSAHYYLAVHTITITCKHFLRQIIGFQHTVLSECVLLNCFFEFHSAWLTANKCEVFDFLFIASDLRCDSYLLFVVAGKFAKSCIDTASKEIWLWAFLLNQQS